MRKPGVRADLELSGLAERSKTSCRLWPFPWASPPSYSKPRPRKGTALAFASPGDGLCGNSRHRDAMKRCILLFPANAQG
jgi:hypothetical protein